MPGSFVTKAELAGPAFEALSARQETLLDFIESLGGEAHLPTLLTRILRHACELIGADHGAIGLIDEQENVMRTEAIYNMPEDELGAVMPPGVGIAGRMLLTGEPVVLGRYGDVGRPSRFDSHENPVIGMPIMWQGKMIGFFCIGVHAEQAARAGRAVHHFAERDPDELAVFARHAAIAIENARRYEREKYRTHRLALIARTGRIIAANLDLQELLPRTADAIHDVLGYPNVAIPLIQPDDPTTLVLNTVAGSYRNIVKGEYRIPISQGLMGAAVRTGQVVLVNDVASDPRHLPTPGAEGITAELAVPIRLGNRVLGVVNVESCDPLGEEDAASLEIVADQLAVAIENARLYERAQRLAALEERQRLARELHDSVTQHIFALNLIAQSLASAWNRDAQEGERRVQRMLDLSRTALAEMRELLAELRPVENRSAESPGVGIALVRQKGLAEALRAHVRQLNLEEPHFELLTSEYRPQQLALEEELFRIVQEALNNAIKHASASQVTVQLRANLTEVLAAVRDNGVGFDVAQITAQHAAGEKLGLSSMRERAAGLGGTLQTRSAPGAGTLVQARVPTRAGTRDHE